MINTSAVTYQGAGKEALHNEAEAAVVTMLRSMPPEARSRVVREALGYTCCWHEELAHGELTPGDVIDYVGDIDGGVVTGQYALEVGEFYGVILPSEVDSDGSIHEYGTFIFHQKHLAEAAAHQGRKLIDAQNKGEH
jgi:hypothetical protein